MAQVAIIVKEDTAPREAIDRVRASVQELNPRARILDARLPIRIEDPIVVTGRRVLAVEDGPTLTHGGMSLGAAALAAGRLGARLVDPRPWAAGSIGAIFAAYPALGPVLPAMGYGPAQRADLERTINAVPCDVVLLGTPMDLRRGLDIRHPVVRVRYEMEEADDLSLEEVLAGI
jgi:predicted GTPase